MTGEEQTATIAKLRELTAQLEEAQRLARIGSWELDLVSQRLTWSAEVFRIFELDPTVFDASYAAFLDAVHPEDRATVDEAYRRSVESGEAYTVVHRLLSPAGQIKHVRERGQTFYDASGRALRSIGTVQDISADVEAITERRRAEEAIAESLREREALLREIHHRVKNNLQIVSSLLYLQSQLADEPRLAGLLRESRDRVMSMAAIHETLCLQQELSHIDFARYLDRLVDGLRASWAMGERVRIRRHVEAPNLAIEIALPCGLIVNELVTNALKHAYPEARAGAVDVELVACDGALRLTVADDGIGLPPGVFEAPATLGLQLVRTLVAQVEGSVEVSAEGGARFTVRIPLPPRA